MSQSMLAMVLDIEVDRHKRELRESFAAARARLIPQPRSPSQLELLMAALQQSNAQWHSSAQQARYGNPYNSGGVQSGLWLGHFGGALGGVFGIPPQSHSSWGF